jgi:signal transduction histidine kinase
MFTHIINIGILLTLIFLAVLFLSKKTLQHVLFSLVTFATFFWILTNYLADISTTYNFALLFSKLAIVGPSFIPALFLHFSLIFPSKIKISKFSYFLIYFPSLLFLYFSRTNINIESVVIRDWGVEIVAGALYNYIFVYFLVYVSYAIFNLVKSYKKSQKIIRLQLVYILLGVGVAAFIGLFTNGVLVILGITRYTSLGFLAAILFIYSTYYGITRYRLMNIRVVLTRSIIFGISVGLVTAIFALSVLLTSASLGMDNKSSSFVIYVIASLLIVLTLDPLKKKFSSITDNIFYKDRIDYQKVAQQASAVVAREIDLEKLAQSITNLLTAELKIKEVLVFIAKDESFHFLSSSKKNIYNLNLSLDFINYIQEHKDFIVTEELIKTQADISINSPYYKVVDKFIKEAEDLKIEMVVPIVDDNKVLNAIFLFSAKNSGDLYNQDDINFLNVLVPQVATAIEKSKLYEEVQVLNRELQAKVDAKTKSLRERNKFLIAMQAVTNKISRTMDLKQINQFIANSIASEFGYIGGILSFVDEKNNILRIGAITENEQSKEVLKILGQDPKDFEAEMKMRDLLGVKTVLSGQMNTSDKMSDFFSPPVEKVVIDQIQEKLGVKTIVGLPIFSEDKIIGIVHFLLAVEESKFTSLDRDTMIALADQVGIVSRNLRLYNNLQATNQDLQVANMRLRELDQAKSEFLSIASHQLRTPISALKGYLSMISDGDFGTVPPKIGKVVKDLFESAARLARLVNIFLNVSRIESGRLKIEKKPLQIGDMIESVIAELHNESDKKGVKLIYKKPKPALPLVAADSDKLREVVLNLIDNSIKYTPKGQIEVSAMVENDNMHFKVQDTGIGIDPEEAKNLFRKFVRASGAAQIHTGGSGLGLFIAQKIIKEHGGQIWVESAGKEQGSIFQFVIPMLGGEPNKEEMQS